jgi:hypothetical protein
MAHPRIVVSIFVLYACGSGTKSDVALLSAGNSVLEDIESAMTEPISESSLLPFRSISVKQFYAGLLARTTDQTMDIGGQKISGVRSAVKAAEPFFNRLGDSFGSWAEFAEAKFDFSTAPGRHITRDVFSTMGRNFSGRSGLFAKLSESPKVKNKPTSDAQDSTLELTDQTTERTNLAALAALSLVLRHSQKSGLGLATNSLSSAECKAMTDLSAVNRIDRPIAGTNRLNICTGTFYKGDNKFDYMITAAHCTEKSTDEFLTSSPSGKQVKGIVVRNAPAPGNQPVPVETPTEESTDISIIAFPAGTARGYMRLASAKATVGQKVTVAGFGAKTQNITIPQDGSLGCGNNIVAANVEQQGVITLYGVPTTSSASVPRGEQSIAGKGDSGGPLIRINEEGKPEIVGITSTGTIHKSLIPPTEGRSKHTDVTSKWSSPYIRGRSTLDISDFPLCTNGSNSGNGFGIQPGIGGIDNRTCRVPPAPDDQQRTTGQPTQHTERQAVTAVN